MCRAPPCLRHGPGAELWHNTSGERHQPELKDDAMYKCILIATDGSEMASKAVTHGIALSTSRTQYDDPIGMTSSLKS
jgi:hypothetical protein